MKQLHIYPTSRAVRAAKEVWRAHEGFVPDIMRIDEFESRALIVPGRAAVDAMQRRLLLREAADFDTFSSLGVPRKLARFFAHSDAFFRFFEELAGEEVSMETLAQADVYAEYSDHLAVLQALHRRYDAALEEAKLYDKAFVWRDGRLSKAFLSRYDRIDIHLEGYLTRAETALLLRVARQVHTRVHLRMTRFASKMRERFEEAGIVLPSEEGTVTIDLTSRRVVGIEPITETMHVDVTAVEERAEQAGAVLAAIAAYVEDGIAPERIAVVLPDESFAPLLRRFDRHRNLNFAMGFAYSETAMFKRLAHVYDLLQTHDYGRLAALRENVPLPSDAIWKGNGEVDVETFFKTMKPMEVEERDEAKRLYDEEKEAFFALFAAHRFTLREWLFLWLERLRELRLDDTAGGRVTVLGVLETRAVTFDAVILPDFNEGIVPATTSKDRFLNSAVRRFAGLPTRSDRENLQKYYFDNLLRRSGHVTILYARSDDRLPSKFLYELGFGAGTRRRVPRDLFYPVVRLREEDAPVVPFDASQIVWSASRLATWVRCPRKYYYRYIKQLSAEDDETFNEGAYLHHVLHRLFEEEHSCDEEVVRKRLATLLASLHPVQGVRARYDAALYVKRMERFLRTQRQRCDEGWRIEGCEVSVEKEIGGLRFTGRIDRIDVRNDEKVLIDYKTGKLPAVTKNTTPEEIEDFQMPLYELMFDNEATSLYCRVLEGTWEPPKRMDLQHEALRMRLEELVATNELVARKTEDLKACTYCDYRLLCRRGEYLNS